MNEEPFKYLSITDKLEKMVKGQELPVACLKNTKYQEFSPVRAVFEKFDKTMGIAHVYFWYKSQKNEGVVHGPELARLSDYEFLVWENVVEVLTDKVGALVIIPDGGVELRKRINDGPGAKTNCVIPEGTIATILRVFKDDDFVMFKILVNEQDKVGWVDERAFLSLEYFINGGEYKHHLI